MSEGKLYYVTGPSGSGKNSLIRFARERLAGNLNVFFAHRYITQPVELGGENYIALTEREFDARLAAGLFAMHWSSRGLRYGIGREVNLWLAKACHVVMNGSREFLDEARSRYPELVAVLVVASPEVLGARLHARGRQSEEQIVQCLECAKQSMRPGGRVEIIENNAELHEAGMRFLRLLEKASAGATA